MESRDIEQTVNQILFTANWLEGNIRDLLKPYQITLQQYQALKLISEAESMVNYTHLKKAVVQKDADISRLVSRLLKLKLITKSAVKGDKRQSRLRLSNDGKELMETLSNIPEKISNLFEHMNDEELKSLNYLLEKSHS